MKKSKEFEEKFWEMVEEAKNIMIAGHLNPDDDSIASILSVYWLVNERYPEKEIRMVCEGEKTDEWEYFENFDKVEFVEKIEKSVDLLIVVDGSNFDRFSDKPEEFKKLASKTICIDHHKNKIGDFDLFRVSPIFSSTAEGVYRLLVNESYKMPKRLAEIFLLGILGDTGNFAYINRETSGVLEVTQNLISKAGLSVQELQSKYQQYSKRILELVGEMISNTKYFDGVGGLPPFQVGFLSREFFNKEKFSDGEISTASHLYTTHYLKLIKGYNWGFTITPRENEECGLSFRSLPGVVNVRKIAEKFNGGGHDLASGGGVPVVDPEKALEIILETLRG
jgi:bifunctional oligoribonuclease and PAP phosphatase NrnA